jgi:diguanylate cyclase (GGDEF)-like protein
VPIHKEQTLGKRKVLPIGWRLSLHVACISIVLCFGVLLFILPYQYGRVEQETIVEARILAEAVANIYQHLGSDHPHDYARRLLLRMARMPYIALVNVLDQQGVVRYSTDSRELGQKNEIRYGIVQEDGSIIVAHVVSERESSVGSVNVVIDRDVMLSETHRLFGQVSVGLLIMIIILSILVKGLVESLVSSRLAKLMGLIENAEQGSFLIRAEVDRPDEIGHVILGFNQLLGVITQIEARHLEKEHSVEDAQVQKSMRIKLEETLFQLERSNERLKDKVSAQELLMEAAHRLGATLKRETVVERLVTLVQEKLSWPQFGVFLIEGKDQGKQWLKLAGSYGLSKESLPHAKLGIGDGIVGIVAQTGTPVLIGNLEKEQQPTWEYQDRLIEVPAIERSGSLMVVPMIHKGRVIGVFLFCHHNTGAFDADDVTLISALAAQTALAIINAELYETTLELATSDPLTGVLNRRAMVKQIEFELARAQRFNTNLALLLVDVDHFKGYNDRMGHVLGDVALKEIARALKDNIRKVDILARFGGEEFCVILPQADIKAAREVAAKLCAAVRVLQLRGVEKQELGYLSVSIGVALVSGEYKDFDSENVVTDIIAMADKALYEAKRAGRDRFVEHIS